MKTIRFASLMLAIWASAVYIRFAPINQVFREKPAYAFVIFLVASLIYRVTLED